MARNRASRARPRDAGVLPHSHSRGRRGSAPSRRSPWASQVRAAAGLLRGPAPAARAVRAAADASAVPSTDRRLASLPVRGVMTTPPAVLLELHPVGGVPLRLLRLIVPPLAFGAGERDCDSDSGGHFPCLPRGERVPVAPGGLEPPTSAL